MSNDEIEKYRCLLKKADNIKIRCEQEWQKSGKFFNVFEALAVEKKEIRHSAFLATLLDPRKLHGLEDTILKLFMVRINFSDFPTKNAEIKTEEVKGENGRLDISISAQDITGNKYKVIIENKIGTGAHSKQLRNYMKSLKEDKIDKYKLIYLTLYGNEPNKEEQVQPEDIKNFKTLSYIDDIYQILSEAINIQNNPPYPVQEIIREYILTIKKLTNQGVDKKMAENLSELLLVDNNMQLARELNEAREQLRNETLKDFIIYINEALKDKGKTVLINKSEKVNIDDLVKNYFTLKKEFWIIIQTPIDNSKGLYFQLSFVSNRVEGAGEVWEEIIQKQKSNTLNLTELNRKYTEALKKNPHKDYLNFIDERNEGIKNFVRKNQEEKKMYTHQYIEECFNCINKVIK